MRFFDVRCENTRGDGSRIGITALVEDGQHTMVQFGLRRWPDDGTSHRLAWTAVDQSRGIELESRGGGLGGGVHPERGAALDGGIWIEGPMPTSLQIRCRLDDDLLIESQVTSSPLEQIPSPIEHLQLLDNGPKSERLGIIEGLESAGWRQGRSIADEVAALMTTDLPPGPFGVTPIAIERWGRLLRIAVSIEESGEPDYPPRWWTVKVGGQPSKALGEHFQSGRASDLIGHLVMIDPAPGRPLAHF